MKLRTSKRSNPARFRGALVRCAPSSLCLFSAALATASAQTPTTPTQHDRAQDAKPGPQPFMSGVRIDWQERFVELDAKVVLREGMLELLACSPQTREHESVFVVRARPWHIFQALGLLAIEPGRPPRYDPENDEPIPATGEALEVTVRCGDASKPFAAARNFMRDLKTKKPPESLHWVFSGSRVLEGQRFAADPEGTVLCVVDFDTALISLDASHTSSNEALWLEANTDAIPPIDSPCTIRIGPARPAVPVLTVTVAPDGRLQIDGSAVTIPELVKRSKPEPRASARANTESEPRVSARANGRTPTGAEATRRRIRLVPQDGTQSEVVAKVIEQLVRAGIDRDTIEVTEN